MCACALITGGSVALVLGESLGLGGVATGLWRLGSQDPALAGSDFSEDRIFVSLVDQIPVSIGIENWCATLFGPDFGNFLTRESGETIVEILQPLREGDKTVAFDGSVMSVVGMLNIMSDHLDAWNRVQIAEQDITAEVEAECERRTAEGQSRKLFEQSPLSICENDWSQVKLRLDELRATTVSMTLAPIFVKTSMHCASWS